MKSIGRLLGEYLDQPHAFNWETQNCCQFCNQWLRYRKSEDQVGNLDHLGRREIVEMLKLHGDLVSACSFFLGRQPVPVTQLKIGDVVHVQTANGHALGILAGSTVAVLGFSGVGHDRVLPTQVGWKIK